MTKLSTYSPEDVVVTINGEVLKDFSDGIFFKDTFDSADIWLHGMSESIDFLDGLIGKEVQLEASFEFNRCNTLRPVVRKFNGIGWLYRKVVMGTGVPIYKYTLLKNTGTNTF